MDSQDRSALEGRLRRQLRAFLGSKARARYPMLKTVADMSGPEWNAYIFGGFARDLVAYGASARPRDVDIVVTGTGYDELQRRLEPHIKRRTRFGGLHLNVEGWRVDLWPLGDTWAFRECKDFTADVENLPKTTFLNIEAVAIELSPQSGRRRAIYSNGFFESMASRTLEINFEPNPYPALCIVRSMLIAARMGFALGPRLTRYIAEKAKEYTLGELVDVQRNHYGAVRREAKQVDSWLQLIAHHHYNADVRPCVLPNAVAEQLTLW